MIEKEYLTVQELSKYHKTGIRNIRKIIKSIQPTTSAELLKKDEVNRWLVHHLLLPKFTPKNKIKSKYYALSIDPCNDYTEADIDAVMKFVYDNMNDTSLEIYYVVEQKKANNKNHLHCYINCNQKRKLIESLRLGFSRISYKETNIYNLEGWKNYMQKENNNIKNIKNKN